MPFYFLDTNVVVKFYHAEKGTEAIRRLSQSRENSLLLSDLSIVETISTFARLCRMHEITRDAFSKLRRRFFADIANGKFLIERLGTEHGTHAIKLIVKCAPANSLRTLDALQFAVAKELNSQSRLDYFLSSDAKLMAVVEKEKIRCINPEDTSVA